ncbi:dipeptidase [Hyphomicrobiales bacterium]|nr:dipeptidase [Hyphomicrobiales bacterium]
MNFIYKYFFILALVALSLPVYGQYLTLDSHIDIPFDYMDNPKHDPGNSTEMQVDFSKMKEGGLDSGFFIVYVGQSNLTDDGFKKAKDQAMLKFKAIHKMIQTYPDKILLALEPNDIRNAKEKGKISAAIGIENGYIIGNNINLLEDFYNLGTRYITLAHIGHNQISDSSIPKKSLNDASEIHGGLSSFGKEVISKMNQLGIMVDISHISDKAALQAIKLSQTPVIASHSSARAIANHPRNLSDNIIKKIANKNGVIQVVAFSSYIEVNKERNNAINSLRNFIVDLTGDKIFIYRKHTEHPQYKIKMDEINRDFPLPSVDKFVDHVDYIVNLVGINYVGISSDFGGGGGIDGWMDASQTKNITLALLERGYSKNDIKKIWSENFLRVWTDVINHSKKKF